jgi:beta-galactosidase
MKLIFSLLFTGFLISVTAGFADIPMRDWENPAMFERNQTPPHTPLAPFVSAEEALKTPYKKSPYLQSLNGVWKFNWAAVPEEAPAEFYRPDYDISRWDDIAVPGNWQMQGFGHPLFRNVHQPFPANPPYPPADYNPVGSYRRTFTVPGDWQDRHILLHFEGVKSASYVYVNGKEIGYDEGGMEPSEYDITDLVTTGENTLAVQVLRYSDGSYLECQDMWRLSGIFRDVYLLAVPQVHIRDFYIHSDLDKRYRDATLTVEADVAVFSGSVAGHQLRLNLLDADGSAVFAKPLLQKLVSAGTVKITQKVVNPKKWSTEHPHLYHITLELIDAQGKVIEALAARTGFRKVEVINQAICINGVPVKFNGVNSHVHHPKTGRTMDVATMRQDLTLMKQFNINCVRTSHYPPNIEYLDLADELGMYIFDETNDEAHATEYLSGDPAWRAMYIDRATRMVYRDRNHPSVVIWSAGNESGSGNNIAALIEAGKKIDPSRIWMYGGNDDLLWFEDIVGPRYPTPDELAKNVGPVPASKDARPSFMDEYQAATGNSCGLLSEYWETIYRYPRLSGGAVWDWVSPGITQPARFVTASDGLPEGFIMGNAQLVDGRVGKAIALSGHDEWVEVYRDPRLDITGDQLSLSLWLYPRRWNGCCPLITKGDHSYGLQQLSRDSLEFYIFSGKRFSAFAVVPADWPYKWHHVAVVYNGEVMRIFIDGKMAGEATASGAIANSAFAVAIGKNTELHGQEHPGELCNSVIDQVRIFARAVNPQELFDDTAAGAVLKLDFETVEERGEFFSLGIGGRTYGLIWPDRRVQPELYELKKVPQPVKIEWADWRQQTVAFTNRHSFTNLSELACTWTLQADGEALQSGELALDIAPLKSAVVRVPFQKPALEAGREYRLLITFSLLQATAWAEKGHEVAWEQLELPYPDMPIKPMATHIGALLTVNEDSATLAIRGDSFEYVFDKVLGRLTSAKVKEVTVMEQGPQLNAWRAPIANELERDWGPRWIANEYRSAGLDQLQHHVEKIEWAPVTDGIRLTVNSRTAADGFSAAFVNRYDYTFFNDGEILLTHHVRCEGKFPEWIPRIGLQMTLPDEFEEMTWYGRGPFETYPDRKKGAKVGVYSGSVANQFVPYLIPQENGNKTDVRWIALTDRDGVGLFISGDELLNVSAHLYSLENLDRAWYLSQLKKDGKVHLYVDHCVTGVGGTPVKTLEAYRVKPGEYRYSIRIKPFDAKKESAEQLGRQAFPE